MLKTIVRRTPFNSEIANEFFSNITGDKYMQDDTLVSVLRAILPPRMKEGDSVRCCYKMNYINPSQPFDGTSEDCEAHISGDIDLESDNLVTIYHFSEVRREESAPYMEAIQEFFVAKHTRWEENEKVIRVFKDAFPIRAYANREKRSVVVFLGESDLKRNFCAIAAAVSSMPWYFSPEATPLTSEERELVECLVNDKESSATSERKFYDMMNRIAAQYDFDKIRVGRLLDGFETRYERKAIESVRVAIHRNDETIADLRRRIREQLQIRRDNTIKLSGLELRINENGETSAIRDLFLNNPRLYLEQVSDSTMVFSVKTDLEYFDPDVLEAALRNRESWAYVGGKIDKEDMVKLLKAVFIDNTIRLQVCGCYTLIMDGGIDAAMGHTFPDGFDNHMPNTHINDYGCLGNHTETITDCVVAGDYVGAIMQCIASCQSLAFGDSTVAHRFMEHMYADRYSGLRLPDGSVVKPSGAVKWMKEQEEQETPSEQDAPEGQEAHSEPEEEAEATAAAEA